MPNPISINMQNHQPLQIVNTQRQRLDIVVRKPQPLQTVAHIANRIRQLVNQIVAQIQILQVLDSEQVGRQFFDSVELKPQKLQTLHIFHVSTYIRNFVVVQVQSGQPRKPGDCLWDYPEFVFVQR